MQTTWQQFKKGLPKLIKAVEQLGVKDNDLIDSFNLTNLDPRCLETTQLTDVDPGSNVWAITTADKPIAAP